ncbi:MAG: class I SAM-dependent methyltransferase [Anaerotardibacter sp.]
MSSFSFDCEYDKALLSKKDIARDIAICGKSLANNDSSKLADKGAHDPTTTFYFVLEKLFTYFDFSKDSHLLDVGCSTGRVLAYFYEQGFPGKATGVELDEDLGKFAYEWTQDFENLQVIQGNVLELPLDDYTHFYLFNPFNSAILNAFLDKIKDEVTHDLVLVHMSDNGENFNYAGRKGWRLRAQGMIQNCDDLIAYACPQHYSVWEYSPAR